MKIQYFAPENSGVALYRFHQPLKELEERGLIELRSWGFDFEGKKYEFPDIKLIKETVDWADIIIVGRKDLPDWLNMIKIFKEFGKKVLLDIDDNIFSISPYLSARQAYDVNGLPMKIHVETARLVDGIIVSTPALEKIYSKYNKVWIVPNGIKYVYQRKLHDGVNIGYMCSSSHLENAQVVEGAIIKLLQKYSNVKFYYTKSFQGFLELIPETIKPQVNYLPFFPLKEYLPYVNNLSLDIGIAPLMKNDFNRCKSNIRVLEYWQNQTAVIASPLDEYAKTINHGYNGYLAEDDEWFELMEDLVNFPEKRKYLIRNSLETIKKYDISIFADKYYEVLRELKT